MPLRDRVFPNIPERLSGLEELAENLWWSWHPAARMVFKMLSRQAWKESGHNPDKMLRELPARILDSAAEDGDYLRHYDRVMSQFRKDLSGTCTVLEGASWSRTAPVAFFSAEYGLHHSLPFYAGGLGFLAGDFIKECSDLRIPLVALGFMYPEGYIEQRIREDGWQEGVDQPMDRDAASISRALDREGNQIMVRVPLFEPPIYAALWKVAVGRIPLYLMDTDIDANHPWNRKITARLYAGDMEQRLRQEIVLGIGGSKILETLGFRASVVHLNEGHAAFALLERIRERVEDGASFDQALKEVKGASIFTTHTPVAAGHDVFPFPLMEKYFRSYWPSLGLERDAFLALGLHPESPSAGFNMTALALRLSGFSNGVSKKHRDVSRRTWQSLWPDLPEARVPIESVTNGVHVPTWIEPKLELLFNEYLGPTWLADHDSPVPWEFVEEIPDEELWKTHYWMKIKLINAIRERARKRWVETRPNPGMVLVGGTLLDPSVLTIGFARRFAAYKRADLIFHDMERLKRLLRDRWRPIQIIFAGKAHPADDPGKRILQRIYNIARDPEMGGRIAFLEDYGEQYAQYMVHGVDVWLNNPLPPMEASGTSGMKAALNGVPHLSILDGWWIEGHDGTNGWAFGDGKTGENRDGMDADAIYTILENEVIPIYYQISEDGVPHQWAKLMKRCIKSNAWRFSARRMVKEYVQKFYTGALKNTAHTGWEAVGKHPDARLPQT